MIVSFRIITNAEPTSSEMISGAPAGSRSAPVGSVVGSVVTAGRLLRSGPGPDVRGPGEIDAVEPSQHETVPGGDRIRAARTPRRTRHRWCSIRGWHAGPTVPWRVRGASVARALPRG
ncbi:hypothetical protein GCM10009613_33750 [Pseudonocardia kongjuensis]|uniref:Uncharacterized protein n=1 Tax=Pseudonocardia kongjuensis TaxID=102227 RepID=A0ABN1XVV5_9PSEU